MSVARVDAMTLAGFLEWEARQEHKYEFDGFEPVAMVGVSRAHAVIQRNVLNTLTNRLRGKSCEPFGSDLKIEVAGTDNIVTDPVLIFEILFDGSVSRDRITTNEEYRLTPSVQRYVMLEQDEPAATVFAREGDRWVGTLLKGDGVLSMPEIGIEVPLAECYEGHTFAADGRPVA